MAHVIADVIPGRDIGASSIDLQGYSSDENSLITREPKASKNLGDDVSANILDGEISTLVSELESSKQDSHERRLRVSELELSEQDSHARSLEVTELKLLKQDFHEKIPKVSELELSKQESHERRLRDKVLSKPLKVVDRINTAVTDFDESRTNSNTKTSQDLDVVEFVEVNEADIIREDDQDFVIVAEPDIDLDEVMDLLDDDIKNTMLAFYTQAVKESARDFMEDMITNSLIELTEKKIRDSHMSSKELLEPHQFKIHVTDISNDIGQSLSKLTHENIDFAINNNSENIDNTLNIVPFKTDAMVTMNVAGVLAKDLRKTSTKSLGLDMKSKLGNTVNDIIQGNIDEIKLKSHKQQTKGSIDSDSLERNESIDSVENKVVPANNQIIQFLRSNNMTRFAELIEFTGLDHDLLISGK